MKTHEINYGKKNKETGEVETIGSCTYNMPENVAEAVQAWGEEVVLSNLIQSITISAQAIARRAETPEAAQKALDSWVPGVAKQRVGSGASIKAIKEALSKMSAEDKAKLYAQIGLTS